MAQRVAINGLADSYMAFNTNYHDTGLFGVYATCDPKKQPVDDLVRACPVASAPHSSAGVMHSFHSECSSSDGTSLTSFVGRPWLVSGWCLMPSMCCCTLLACRQVLHARAKSAGSAACC
jgi:hypothetical protein